MNYKIIKNGEVWGEAWDLLETRTEQVIGTYPTAQDAQVAKSKFNRGYGFDGWTPAFMLEKYLVEPKKKSRISTK
jgi:hypothetical protein